MNRARPRGGAGGGPRLPAFFIFVFFILTCRTLETPPPAPEEHPPAEAPGTAPPAEDEVEIIEETPPRRRLTLTGAGDNLFHISILQNSREKGGYSFSPIYQEIKPLIQGADLAFINQETVMGGEKLGYSGYPRFNTPPELAQTLVETGFSIINHANNHAMDMGEAGLTATMDVWDAQSGVTYLGIHRSMEKKQAIIIKNGVSLGFLAYTYGTNGLHLPKDRPYLVSLINREVMAQEIDALRPRCDVLVVSMHWGDEYALQPSAAQRELAAFLAEHGVDLVIGHHPHVLQGVEVLPRPDGKRTVCFYSLGNFVSNQQEKETLLGALLYAEIVKEGGQASIAYWGLIPVVTHYERGYTGTRVYPLYAYSADLLERHALFARDAGFRREFIDGLLAKLNADLIMRNPFALPEGLSGP